MVITFSRKAAGTARISENFKISEFACKDGSDEIKIDTDLVVILQQIRDHFGSAVTISSGYRTPAHDKAVGGSGSGYHTKGQAVDIVIGGVDPLTAGLYAAELLGPRGGIEIGNGYLHIDTRADRWRAFTENGGGSYTTVTDFGTKLKRDF